MENYPDGEHDISYDLAIEILENCQAEDLGLWGGSAFIDCLKTLSKAELPKEVVLIIRRDRKISKGTGTLLSEDDRKKTQQLRDSTCLVLYKITGETEKGWHGKPFWLPNIKLPRDSNFHLTLD